MARPNACTGEPPFPYPPAHRIGGDLAMLRDLMNCQQGIHAASLYTQPLRSVKLFDAL